VHVLLVYGVKTLPKTLEHIVGDYIHAPIPFFDNLNMDISTYSPRRFYRAKRITEELEAELAVFAGNFATSIGDHDTFARNRDWVGTHFKRPLNRTRYEPQKINGQKIGTEIKELNELDDKIDYFAHQVKDWKIKRLIYTLGSHDQIEMVVRTVGELNEKVNRYELNTLRSLGNQPEQVDYMLSLSQWAAQNGKTVDVPDAGLEESNPEEYQKQVDEYRKKTRKLVKEHDKDFFGEKPVKKMKSKSDLDQHTIHEAFRGQRQMYIDLLNSKIPKIEVAGFKFNDDIYGHSFEIAANLTSARSPQRSGFANLVASAERRLGNEGTLPDFMVQGMHGTMHFKPFRWYKDQHKYSYLMQIPSFEDPSEGFKWRKLQTSALETTKRHDRMNAPLGIPVLYVGEGTTPHSLAWIGKDFLDSNKRVPKTYHSMALHSDWHVGSADTYHSLLRKAIQITAQEQPDAIAGLDDILQAGHWASANKSDNPVPPAEDFRAQINRARQNGERAFQEFLEGFDLSLENQIRVAQRMTGKLSNSLIKGMNGNLDWYVIGGHHLELMAIQKGENWSFGPYLIEQIKSKAEMIDLQEPIFDEIQKKNHKLLAKTAQGNISMWYHHEAIEAFGENAINGYNTILTHQFKGGGHDGSHNNILHRGYDRGELKRAHLSISGHFHTSEYLAMGNLFHIARGSFQGVTPYGNGYTWSKGPFGNTDVKFDMLYSSPGPQGIHIVKSWTSDVLEKLIEQDDPDQIWGF